MRTKNNNKSSLYVLMAAGMMLYSCQNELAIPDKGLNEGEYPLALNVGSISRAGADDVKKTWNVGDVFGAKIEGNDVIGKYKITDVATGATEAVEAISWHTSVQSEVYAWYPVDDQTDISLGGYAGAGLLVAKTLADYTAPANLTFSSPLAKIVCVLKPAPGVTLDENAEVSFNTFTKVDFKQGVISPVEGTQGEITAEKEVIEENTQYTALLCPGEIATDNYFLKVVSGANTYKMTMSDAARLEAGKTYTFNVTVKDKGEIVWSVSTIAGTGTEGSPDSKISTEQDAMSVNLYKPFWLTLDNNNNLYSIQYNGSNKGALNKINLTTGKIITSIFIGDGGMDSEFKNFYASIFTPDYKNILLSQDRGMGNNDLYSFAYANSTVDFNSKQKEANRIKEVKGMAICPVDKDYLFLTDKDGKLYRFNLKYSGDIISEVGTEKTDLGYIKDKVTLDANPYEGDDTQSVTGRNWYDFNIQFAPDGTFAYFVSRNRNIVVKASYDNSKHEFSNFTFVAGEHSYKGAYADGTGKAAKFSQPHQGAFDMEGNFYLCDAGNHCIRKIDLQGNVTTFAGNPSENAYKDGALSDATFKAPIGIAFDAVNNVFYVADWEDHRIRVIKGQ